MRCLGLVALLSFLGVSAALPAADAEQNPADNWPQWRGPEASGFAAKADPPLKWDDKTNVRWKTPIPGRGSSTPIVWGDQTFILTAIDTGKQADAKDIPKPDPKFEKDKKTQAPTTYHQFVVLSVDRQTGKVRWQQTATEAVPHEGHHETHSYAAFSPITDGKYLYVSFGSRGVYCYDLAGKLQWQRQDLGRLETRYGWGEGNSPALYRDTLFVNFDHEGQSFLVALDARTGKTKWKVDRDEVTSWSTPLVVERQGKAQLIVNAAKRVRSYDPATGKVIWECGGQTPVNVIPSPVIFENLVICTSGYRGAAAIGIPLDSSGDVTGKAAWQHDRGTPYVPSPVLTDGRLYFTQMNTGMLTCLDARTGKVIFEKERLPGLASLYTSPVAAKDRIYFTGRDGTVVVIKRSDKLEVLATNKLGEGIDASPVMVGKQLFLRGEKHLYCIVGD
jgi:outer membrane protein assembly factor BamB